MRTGKFKLHRPELDPDPPKIERVVEDGQTYAVRNGSRFKIETLHPDSAPSKAKRKEFKLVFVRIPRRWAEALQGASGGAYDLALAVLAEEFQRERIGGEIALSTQTTGMPPTTRHRAAKELEQLGLIKLSREGKHTLRVILI